MAKNKEDWLQKHPGCEEYDDQDHAVSQSSTLFCLIPASASCPVLRMVAPSPHPVLHHPPHKRHYPTEHGVRVAQSQNPAPKPRKRPADDSADSDAPPKQPKPPKRVKPSPAGRAGDGLPYDLQSLTWNRWHTRNEEGKYSYDGCQKDSPALQCKKCKQWYYVEDIAEGVVPAGYLPFQENVVFTCRLANCGKGQEECNLEKASWIKAIRSSMMHLMWCVRSVEPPGAPIAPASTAIPLAAC